MKTLLEIEDLALFVLGAILFFRTGVAWWWFAVLLFAPDVSMVGYIFGTRVGAITYNFVHHHAVAIVCWIIGVWFALPILQGAGAIMLAHSALDRTLGYGLKYTDSFKHTHLGWIGSKKV